MKYAQAVGCLGELREDCEKQLAKRAMGDVVVNVPAAKRQRVAVPAETPSTVIMATPVAVPVQTTNVPPPLTSHQTDANHDAEEAAEALALADLREEDIKNAALARIMQYPELPGPYLVWGNASQKNGCWIFCNACGAWAGTASHDVVTDPDGKCVHYTETVKTRFRVAMDPAAGMVRSLPRLSQIRPPRFSQATLDSLPDSLPFLEGEVRGMMDH